MARIIVLGGGVCGLSAGMMLARDGHEITVLERDADPVPESVEEAWEKWSRDGVTQFRMAHFLQPAGRAVLEEELPDVFAGLVAAGALRLDLLGLAPPNLTEGGPRAGDERFVTYTARRSTFEQVLGKAAEERARCRGASRRGREGADHAARQRDAARDRRPAGLGRDAARRPRGRRDGPALAAGALVQRCGHRPAAGGVRGFRVHLLRPLLPLGGRDDTAAFWPAAGADRDLLDPDSPFG